MADFGALEDPHYKTFPLQAKLTSRNNRGSKFFCSNFLFRLLFVALFLSVLPLFASEAPDFISHTVFAKSWELVHLFIIGIIVSYGLFGRRKTQTQMRIQTSPTFNSPNMLHASTIFNFEHQNPCEYGVYGNANVNQAWDFRPYGLEPTVVGPGTRDFDYEPLDLPVRSLRSRVEESDSEVCASEFENEADASSSCCCYEEDNESENLEENNVVDSSSPTPWNWPNSAQHGYLSSPCVVNPEAKQASYENCGRGLSNQSSPLCSSESGSQSMDVEVESSWSGSTREETVLVSQPMMADPKEEVSGVCFARDFHEVKHVKTRSFRVSSSKGSSPFSPSLSESPPMEVENSRRESVEVGSSLMEETLEDTKLFPSPPTSLKSRSMRVDFKEKVGRVSVQVDNKCQNLPHSKASSSEFSPLCSTASRSATAELQRGSKRQHLKFFRSPKSVSPMCDFISPSTSESPPTEEMESLKRESKQVDNILKEMSEDHHIPSSSGQANDFPLRRFRSRKRDDFGKDVKGEIKSRTDSLRSESSCDTTSSKSPSSSSHIFTPTIEPKQSPDTGKSTQVEMNASESDLVLPTESSRTQLGAGSSLSTDVVGKSGASIERDRITLSTSSTSPSSSSHIFTPTIEPKQSPDTGKSTQVEMNASESDLVLPTESSRTQLGAGSSLSTDVVGQSGASIEQDRITLSRTPHSRRFSIGSFFDRDPSKGSKDATKETTKKGKDETGSNSGKCGWDCLKLDVRPTLTKNSLRGKSVRTVRPQALTLEPSCTNEPTDERVRERQDVVIISIGISKKNNTRNQKCTSTARQERSESSSPELGKNKERSSAVEDVNEDEECNSEIDRKADEFIAKFKEQIRLQKVTSRRVSSKH